MNDFTKHDDSSSVIGIDGRHVLLYVDDDDKAEDRFVLQVNGDPVKPARVATRKAEFARGVNLLASSSCAEEMLPWRIAGGKDGRLGCNLIEKWHLADGFTAYLSAAPAEMPLQLEYVDAQERAFVPVAGGETYRFEGYFGSHRCQASVHIALRDDDGALVTTFERPIAKKLGGRTLDDYERVDFTFVAPSGVTKAEIRLSVDQYVASSTSAANAFLFFTHVAFGIAGESGSEWRANGLGPDRAAALARNAAVVDITLPRLPVAPSISPPQLEAIDRRTGEPAEGAPVVLPAAGEMTFAAASFDGVTLSGEVRGARGEETLELTVDGAVAAAAALDPADDGAHRIRLRIGDDFLDGAPHILELRDAKSGKCLFLNAALVKAFVTPWEVLEDFSRSPWPLELHPMARRRYQNLAAHMEALASVPDGGDIARQLGQSFAYLSRAKAELNPWSPFVLPSPAKPEVSVVMYAPDFDAAYRTIAALILSYNTTPYEVIVAVEDKDDIAKQLGKYVAGARVVHAAPNKGFAPLCNKAAAKARGRFVALLGAPAEPGACWLDELRRTFDLFDGVGLAGAKLVRTNGRLHEAGGLVSASGHRQPVGANGNAEHPQVSYARQTDDVSGAAMMISRDTWKAIGGLSEDFFDRGLEDTDLAFKVRAHGLKVVYAPHAAVTVEGPGAPGQKTAKPAKDRDSVTAFKRKWADTALAGRTESIAVREAMDGGIAGRVLFIDHQVPRGDVDGGSYAAIQEMRLFQALGYKVTLLPINLTHLGVYTRALQRMGVEVIHAPFAVSVEDTLKERGTEFDLVYITRHHVARTVLPSVRRHNPRAKVIFNNADLHFLRELRAALAAKDAELLRRSQLTRELELEVMRQADLTLSYSEVEHAVIQSHNLDQTKVAKAPWVATAAAAVAPFAKRRDLVFVGSFGHQPNVEAVKFFAASVMPFVRRRLPDVRFVICGSEASPDIKALGDHDIVVAGHVDDLGQVFAAARLFVAPLMSGAGLKAKVLSAMGHGVPAVLSPAAAEGIGAQAGSDYLVAQSPEEWADAIAALYGDEARWKKMSQNALGFVRDHYSFEQGVDTLRRALESIDIFATPSATALCCRLPLPPLV